jgi:hypothetical protein
MVEGTPQRRTAFYRAVARSLEDIADNHSDARRRAQLQSVADGFERYADRIEQAFADVTVN